MSNRIIQPEISLVRPSGELLVARVRANWSVQIGPDWQTEAQYGPEQALCLLAMARHLDEPMTIAEVAGSVIETGSLSPKPNPLTENTEDEDSFHEQVLIALGKLRHEQSVFRDNTIALGGSVVQRLVLMGNVHEHEYGKGVIDDFFKNHHELADPEDPDSVSGLERAYRGSLDRELRRMQNASGANN